MRIKKYVYLFEKCYISFIFRKKVIMSVPVEPLFTLRSDDYESEIAFGFQRLRKANALFDMTLVCDGGEVQCHEALLASLSPHFQEVFMQNSSQKARLDLPGVKFDYVRMMVEFIYEGEVEMPQHEAKAFFAATDLFKVKGLYSDPADKAPIKSEPPAIKSEPPDQQEEDNLPSQSISAETPGTSSEGHSHSLPANPSAVIPASEGHSHSLPANPSAATPASEGHSHSLPANPSAATPTPARKAGD